MLLQQSKMMRGAAAPRPAPAKLGPGAPMRLAAPLKVQAPLPAPRDVVTQSASMEEIDTRLFRRTVRGAGSGAGLAASSTRGLQRVTMCHHSLQRRKRPAPFHGCVADGLTLLSCSALLGACRWQMWSSGRSTAPTRATPRTSCPCSGVRSPCVCQCVQCNVVPCWAHTWCATTFAASS
jgi:hypothetical protein